MTRVTIKTRTTLLLLLAIACGEPAGRDHDDKPTNLLLVTLDTLRADRLGCYGYEQGRTPSVDALASRGVLFEQAFTPAPMTLPAHATMMTGLLPPQHGARVNGEHRLADDVPTLAEHLAASGYRTGAFVAAFVLNAKFGLDRGFDHYGDDLDQAYEQDVPESLSTYRAGALVVDEALHWLETGDADAPFFAWVHLYDAHYPWHPHGDDTSGGGAPADPAPGTRSDSGSESGTYDGEVSYADAQLGRLLAALVDRNVADDTLVIVLADHGEGLGDHHEIEHAYLLNEEVLRVPWIVAGPGVTAGHRVSSLVALEDMLPTTLELLGLTDVETSALPGRDLSAALRGESIRPGMSYAETDLPWVSFRWAPQRSLTTEDWKYIRTPLPELYERRNDPGEFVNLVDVRPEIRDKLEARLAALEDELGERRSELALLTDEEIESLAALGYLTGSSGSEARLDLGELADVKQRLAAKDLISRLRNREAQGDISLHERLKLTRELVALSPETPSFHSRLASALTEQGLFEEAILHLSEVVALAPGSANAHYELGDLLQQRGRTAEARPEIEAALALGPDMAAPHVSMGNVLLAEGRPDLAAAQYTEALRLRPGYAEAHYNMAQAFLVQGHAERAMDQLHLAIEHRPRWALAHATMAGLMAEQGLLSEAIARYGTALELAPDVAEHSARLARLLAACPDDDLRDAGRAVALAEQAAKLTRARHAQVLDTLAIAYAAAGRFAAATTTARRAQELATADGDLALAAEIEVRLSLFAEGGVWTDARLESPVSSSQSADSAPAHGAQDGSD
jgi:arylsulfatase A-like enzyme/Flp pilus assembly protein TadD